MGCMGPLSLAHTIDYVAYKSSDVEEKLENCASLASPASKYAFEVTSERNKASDFCGLAILNHREGHVGNDVSLYYVGFQNFMDNCAQIKPTPDDYSFAMELCTEMAKYYPSEVERQTALCQLLVKYSPNSNIVMSKRGEGRCDIVIDDLIYIELKNEVGSTGAESFSEAVSYYIQHIHSKGYKVCSVPGYIIEVVGPNLFISGAVFGQDIYIDRLASVWLVPQTQNHLAMLETARVLAALRRAIGSIKQFYHNLPTTPTADPRFPAFNSIGNFVIKYECQLKPHLFRGTVDGARVVVKFCEAYCEEAHRLLENMGYAPKLYCCYPVSSRFKMIVMEFVEGRQLCEYLSQEEPSKKQNILAECALALQGLHDKNLCHGDFRDQNVLVRENGKVCVLDYEWAGQVGQVRYPGFMNHAHITWPDGVFDGEIITKAHDRVWLEKFSLI